MPKHLEKNEINKVGFKTASCRTPGHTRHLKGDPRVRIWYCRN